MTTSPSSAVPVAPPVGPPAAAVFQRDCVMLSLRRAARAVSRRYEDALRPVGLTASQFSILAALLRDQAVPIGPVAEALGMDRTTLTHNLVPLVRRGLVGSSPHPPDARIRLLALTEAGQRLMHQAVPLWRQAQEDSLARVDAGRWADAKAVLGDLL